MLSRKAQWIAIPLIALCVSNILIKGPLPFAEGYQFPVRPFLALMLAIFCICESNRVVYRYLDKRVPFHVETGKRVMWQAIGSFLATLVAFIPIRFFNALWTNEETTPRTLLFYGFVAFSLSTAFNGAHVILYFIRLVRYKDQWQRSGTAGGLEEQPPIARSGTLAIETGNRTLLLDMKMICWWHSSGGKVSIVKSDGVRFTTNYTSFSMIVDKLPETGFFQLNRQVIANRMSINSVQNGQNGQLVVLLRTPEASGQTLKVRISKYKKAAFRAWLDN